MADQLPDFEEYEERERQTRFQEYQRTFRDDQAAINAELNLKTEAEKSALDTQLERALTLQQGCDRHHDELNDDLQRVRKLIADPVKNFTELDQKLNRVLRESGSWSKDASNLFAAYVTLEETEQKQHEAGHGSEATIAEASARAKRADEESRRIKDEIAVLEREAAHGNRLFPEDSEGRRPMPKAWKVQVEFDADPDGVAKFRAIDSMRASASAREGEIGLQNPRGARNWVPWWRARDAEGTQSEGWLWMAFDENERVMDRVFRKDVFYADSEWDNVRYFDGDMRDQASKTPWELACHNAVLGVEGVEHVVRLREGRRRELIDHEAKKFRMYVEWCEHGDLGTLLGQYQRERKAVPEPLAQSALAMATGTISAEDNAAPVADWRETVHRDIKPSNIFLAPADPELCPYLPKPLLGNFGIRFLTTPTDPNSPFWFGSNSLGTKGYISPEQTQMIDQNTLLPIPGPRLSEKTNIWAIGAVLAAMVRGREPETQPVWLGQRREGEVVDSAVLPMDQGSWFGAYSVELRLMINACLSYDAGQRPSARDLVVAIQKRTAEDPPAGSDEVGPDRAEGMRSGRAGVPGPEYIVPRMGDKYQLGLARRRQPAQKVL